MRISNNQLFIRRIQSVKQSIVRNKALHETRSTSLSVAERLKKINTWLQMSVKLTDSLEQTVSKKENGNFYTQLLNPVFELEPLFQTMAGPFDTAKLLPFERLLSDFAKTTNFNVYLKLLEQAKPFAGPSGLTRKDYNKEHAQKIEKLDTELQAHYQKANDALGKAKAEQNNPSKKHYKILLEFKNTLIEVQKTLGKISGEIAEFREGKDSTFGSRKGAIDALLERSIHASDCHHAWLAFQRGEIVPETKNNRSATSVLGVKKIPYASSIRDAMVKAK